MKQPNPNVSHPVPGYPVTYVKPTITRPNIEVGDFTYYNGENLETQVTHHYEFIVEKVMNPNSAMPAEQIKAKPLTAERTILHWYGNAFFASVEETFKPELKLVPMAVAEDASMRRRIILAKKYKIRTAEMICSAKRKCPELVIVSPSHGAYSEFCERVNAIYETYTPLVERFGIDESFLDLKGCLYRRDGDGLAAANDIQERVKREIGVTISIGVSWNKIFAKLGSDYKKPEAVIVIYLSDSVAMWLCKHGLKCRIVQVMIKDTALKSLTRQSTLPKPSHISSVLTATALELIHTHWAAKRGSNSQPVYKPIRMFGVTAENLGTAGEAELEQLTLFDTPPAKTDQRQERLELALDDIRGKYGKKSVIPGNDSEQGERRMIFWDFCVPIYDFAQQRNSGYLKMVEYVVGVVPKDVKVLEATAGTADISVAVADKAERVLCTDLSEKMLKITEHKAKYKTNIGFAIRGIYDLKEPDNSYDVVTASQVLHLLDKPELAATELKRITKDIIIAPIVNLDFEGYKDFLNKIGLQDC